MTLIGRSLAVLLWATPGLTVGDRLQAGEWIVSMIDSEQFHPSEQVVHVGDTVTWRNDDTTPHQVLFLHPPTGDHRRIHRVLRKGGRFTLRFPQIGEFHYECRWHGMHGVIRVIDVAR